MQNMWYAGKEDFVYSSSLLRKLIRKLAGGARVPQLETLIYKIFKSFFFKTNLKLVLIYLECLEKLKPVFGMTQKRTLAKKKTKKRRKLKVEMIPGPLLADTQYRYANAWLCHSIKSRVETKLGERVVNEITEVVFENRGSSLKKKKTYYKSLLSCKDTTKNFRWK